MARRRNLRGGEAARSIEILGSEMSAGALALRTYAARAHCLCVPRIPSTALTSRVARPASGP